METISLDHEKLDVYRISLDLVMLVDEIVKKLPKGRAYLADQFLRAVTSISLNIAEGAGEYARLEKARFYRMAKRSATECSAILDICFRLELIDTAQKDKCKLLLIRIVAMLIKMAKTS